MLRLLSTLHPFSKSKASKIAHIPSLKAFLAQTPQHLPQVPASTTLSLIPKLTYFLQTYGCQMNVSDSQLVRSILSNSYLQTTDESKADIVMLNTCAIRDSAQQKIYQRVNELKNKKIVAVLGCMAERVKEKMINHGVDIVCGPDAYRELPRLIEVAKMGEPAVDVQLSVEETYAEIKPVRRSQDSVLAFLSIMRGCNNMCSFCIVPFVRGRERSRPLESILKEIDDLDKQGVKEITFLGQNVNSYHDCSDTNQTYQHKNSEDFNETYRIREGPGPRFAQLLDAAASAHPEIRFRFTSPHPKDFPDEVISVMAKHNNICKYIHLPAQSGNSNVLKRMRRNHTREAYLNLVKKLKEKLPGLTLSTDLICGFCGQTEEEFADTISLLKEVKFQMAYLFMYSMRPKTHAHRNYQDDVPQQVKKTRLTQMIKVFETEQALLYKKQVGNYHLLLIQGRSKRDADKMMGKTDTFKKGFVTNCQIPTIKTIDDLKQTESLTKENIKKGDYVLVKVIDASTRSLYCEPIAKITINDYAKVREYLKRQEMM